MRATNQKMKGHDNTGKRHYPFATKTLITQEEIWKKTIECAKKIAQDYKSFNLSANNPLVLVCVLKGSFLFTADIARFLMDEGVPLRIEFICVSSYGKDVKSSGQVRLLLDVRESVEQKHVMLIEDIVDSANTLLYLNKLFLSKKPASLKTTVLLNKLEARTCFFKVDYAIFTIPNTFVVGYGLDFAEDYRELRDVVVLKKEIYEPRLSKL